MRAGLARLGITLLALYALPVQAADLAKIERVIAKEPKYEGKPTYCLLAFGPEADFRVWLVLDGTVLYVDRNGNGDLTEPNKRVVTQYRGDGSRYGFRPGPVGTPDGKVKFTLSQIRMHDGCCDIEITSEGGWSRAGFDGPGALRFVDRVQDAPIIHFLGPLTLQRFDPHPGSASAECGPKPLIRGRTTTLAFSLGTPGLGNGTFAKFPFLNRLSGDNKLTASAEVRFPGGKTVTVSLEPDG